MLSEGPLLLLVKVCVPMVLKKVENRCYLKVLYYYQLKCVSLWEPIAY
ncbi:MAG: hypothetical protein ACI9LO_003538 [Planctomycetota bacterium]|jgi:hypothetical protein